LKGEAKMSIGCKKILWLSDEIDIFRSQITFLETRGYSVIPILNSSELLDLIGQDIKIADLILIDAKADGTDSISIVSAIRKIDSNLPVVLITQKEAENSGKSNPATRIDAVITKPFITSQFLAICKKLLNTSGSVPKKLKEAFIRSYSEIKTILARSATLKEYLRIYEKLVFWDLEIENSGDEGLRQALAGLKSDIDAGFSNYVVQNYCPWINAASEAPLLGYRVIEKRIMPLLTEDRKCLLVVISGMRFDQYLQIERALNNLFNVKRQYFLATLPSAEEFSRNSFFAGELPVQIDSRIQGLLKEPHKEDETNLNQMENQLLFQKFSKNGEILSDQEPYYSVIKPADDASSILAKIQSCQKSRLITMVLEFEEHLCCTNLTEQEQIDFQSEESARRLFTDIWFQKSEIFKAIQSLASQDITLVITSDHGSVLCNRTTEVYNTGELNKNRRYKFGVDISADERRVVFISEPSHFGLPSMGENMNCIIAKENYCFSHPEKIEFASKEYRAGFQKGGISMEELIMPLGIFQPKEG
jgi:DNA-binding response OmpR family regulator